MGQLLGNDVRTPKLGSDKAQLQTDARRNVTECDPRHSVVRNDVPWV